MCSKILLRKEKDHFYANGRASAVQWKRSLPFFLNCRGYLIHRVRSAKTHVDDDGTRRHSSVHYLCGNFTSCDDGEFFADPPTDRLLCVFCEFAAKKLSMPSADAIAGRHVHIGKIRAERVCCVEATQSN